MNEVKWSKRAKRQLAKVPINYRVAITDATRTLVNFPECKNVKPLKNHKYGFRLRVGRHRIFFDFDGQIKIIAIQEVKKRDERTY
ncbi:MAG: type II toxin-antitoxin system RelE/ParE family toxin [Desulfobacterales bacterium]|jgi:mRNA-degrading endonuclease RelE of RelBE toxin-antitoxin system